MLNLTFDTYSDLERYARQPDVSYMEESCLRGYLLHKGQIFATYAVARVGAK